MGDIDLRREFSEAVDWLEPADRFEEILGHSATSSARRRAIAAAGALVAAALLAVTILLWRNPTTSTPRPAPRLQPSHDLTGGSSPIQPPRVGGHLSVERAGATQNMALIDETSSARRGQKATVAMFGPTRGGPVELRLISLSGAKVGEEYQRAVQGSTQAVVNQHVAAVTSGRLGDAMSGVPGDQLGPADGWISVSWKAASGEVFIVEAKALSQDEVLRLARTVRRQ